MTGFVRELVAREKKRHTLEAAADAYARLLKSNPAEAEWLAQWEAAPLVEAPKRRRK